MINKWLSALICLLISLPLCAYAGYATIKDIRVVEQETATRIAFVFTSVDYIQPKIFTLQRPNRLIFDFTQTHLGVNLKKLHFDNPLIVGIRSGFPGARVLRLVLDTKNSVRFKTKRNQNEWIVDIPKAKKTVIKKIAIKKMIIVIDPGHGGKDTGAIGINGIREKNIVLSIAKRLADMINAQPAMKAELTRNGDYFVHLRDRLKLARRGKADLFIAIHADSYFTDQASGATVYALSQNGATNEAARWLARRDNYSELGGVNLGDLGDQSIELRSVLIDLAQTESIKESLRLGKYVLNELDNVTRLHHERVEQAPFVVLKSPDIPSILVETGYLSNPKEELRLRDPVYQHKIASALFNGIKRYLKK
jgi:N-acetylmuramoyl-L-alanine amidase